jgi:hypothetical protein
MPVDVTFLHPPTPVLQIVQPDRATLLGMGTLLSPLRSVPSIQRLSVGQFVSGVPLLGMVVSAGTSSDTYVASDLLAPAAPSHHVLGLVVTIAPLLQVQSGGIVAFPVGTWDAVTGDVGGLVPGADYFLGTVAGHLTRTPTPAGLAFQVGVAIDANRMILSTPRIKRG